MRGVANISGDYPKVSERSIISVKFSGNYVKENKSIYHVKSVVNIYIVYSLDPISNTRNTDFTAQNCLLGAVKLTKDVSTSNYKYEGYGICFDEGSSFSIGNITNGKDVIDITVLHILIIGKIIFICWVKTLFKVLQPLVQEIQFLQKKL